MSGNFFGSTSKHFNNCWPHWLVGFFFAASLITVTGAGSFYSYLLVKGIAQTLLAEITRYTAFGGLIAFLFTLVVWYALTKSGVFAEKQKKKKEIDNNSIADSEKNQAPLTWKISFPAEKVVEIEGETEQDQLKKIIEYRDSQDRSLLEKALLCQDDNFNHRILKILKKYNEYLLQANNKEKKLETLLKFKHNTAYHLAAQHPVGAGIIRTLSEMENGSSWGANQNSQSTALHDAALSRLYLNVKALLAKADPMLEDNSGLLPIDIAIQPEDEITPSLKNADKEKTIEILINCMNDRGITPLHHAIIKKDLERIKRYLKHGAQPFVKKDLTKQSPYEFALQQGQQQTQNEDEDQNQNEIVQMLDDWKNQQEKTFWAAIKNENFEEALEAVKRVSDVNCVNEQGQTALEHLSLSVPTSKEGKGKEIMILAECLIQAKATTTINNRSLMLNIAESKIDDSYSGNGDTHVPYKATFFSLFKHESLLYAACDTDQRNVFHLLAANQYGPQEAGIGGLLALQMNAFDEIINQQDRDGNTPLHLACNNQHYGTQNIEALLKWKYLDLDLQNDQKQTALHLAVQSRNLARVKLLIGKGINKLLRDKNGKTAEALAQEMNEAEIAQLISDYHFENKQNFKRPVAATGSSSKWSVSPYTSVQNRSQQTLDPTVNLTPTQGKRPPLPSEFLKPVPEITQTEQPPSYEESMNQKTTAHDPVSMGGM